MKNVFKHVFNAFVLYAAQVDAASNNSFSHSNTTCSHSSNHSGNFINLSDVTARQGMNNAIAAAALLPKILECYNKEYPRPDDSCIKGPQKKFEEDRDNFSKNQAKYLSKAEIFQWLVNRDSSRRIESDKLCRHALFAPHKQCARQVLKDFSKEHYGGRIPPAADCIARRINNFFRRNAGQSNFADRLKGAVQTVWTKCV